MSAGRYHPVMDTDATRDAILDGAPHPTPLNRLRAPPTPARRMSAPTPLPSARAPHHPAPFPHPHEDSMTQATLATVLVDTYALAVKTHAAHWNVTGPQFFQLHDAFSTQYEALFTAADDIAERLRAQGQQAPTGLNAIAKSTHVADIQGGDGRALAASLRDDHRALSKACSEAAKAADAAGDDVTVDLLVGRAQEHDKTAWMLGAAAQ